MKMTQTTQIPNTSQDATEAQWRVIFRIGGVTALIAAALFLSDIIVMLSGIPMPATAREWFDLMQQDRVKGLLELFFSDLFGLALLIPFIAGLYGALRRAHPVYAALTLLVAFVGMAVIFAISPNYAMLYLHDQLAAATTEAQRLQILTGGETLFTTAMWSTGFLMAGLLLEGAMLIFSTLMLRSGVFGRWPAWLGILGHGLDCLHFIALLALIPVLGTDQAAAIGMPLLPIGGTFQLVWYPLVALRLLKLGRRDSEHEANPSG
jgi:hypothetical protein